MLKRQVTKIVVGVGSGLSIGLLLLYIGYAMFLADYKPTDTEGDTTVVKSQNTMVTVDCGSRTALDEDGDGVSNSIEQNETNQHLFHPNRCDEDPSIPKEKTLEGGINLKDKNTGYLHVTGGDKSDTDDWGTLDLISCLEAVGRKAATNNFQVIITDLSRQHGGAFLPHVSHQNGLDVDMRYVAIEGYRGPLDLVLQPDLYDEVATQEVLQEFVANKSCDPEFIFVDMDALQFTGEDIGTNVLMDAKGHSNHFHVRIKNKKHKTVTASMSMGVFLKRLAAAGLGFAPDLAAAAMAQLPSGPTLQRDLLPERPTPATRVLPRLQSKRPMDLVATKETIPAILPKSPIVVRIAPNIVDRTKIQRRAIDSAMPVDFFSLQKPHVRIREVEVVPQDQYVAVIETAEGTFDKDGVKYKKMPKNRLRVLDAKGATVCYPGHDVRAHAFSPDGTKIAFIEGSFYEGGVGFITTGVFILDIRPCIVTNIKVEDAALPYDLEWLQTDSEDKIFMQVLDPENNQKEGLPVRVYDVKRNKTGRTSSRGIHFSPDGTHYLVKPHEAIQGGLCKAGQINDSCLRVYKANKVEALKDFRNYDRGKPVGWSYDNGAQLLFSKTQFKKVTQSSRSRKAISRPVIKGVLKATNILVDVDTKKEVEKFDGEVLGITNRRGWITGKEHILLRPNLEDVPSKNNIKQKLPTLRLRRAPSAKTLNKKALPGVKVPVGVRQP